MDILLRLLGKIYGLFVLKPFHYGVPLCNSIAVGWLDNAQESGN